MITLKLTCKCKVTRIATKNSDGGENSLYVMLPRPTVSSSPDAVVLGKGEHRPVGQDREQVGAHSTLLVEGQRPSARGAGQ